MIILAYLVGPPGRDWREGEREEGGGHHKRKKT